MPEQEKRATPIRQSVDVDCPIEDAFQLFTDEFGAWWPLKDYSVSASDAETCIIQPWVGGRVFERSRTGEEHDWGSVTCWEPPGRLSFTWDPGGTGDDNQSVDIQFEAQADGTRVTLIHRGWEAPGVAVCSTFHNCSSDVWAAALTRCFFAFVADQMVVA